MIEPQLIAQNIASIIRPYYEKLDKAYQWKTDYSILPELNTSLIDGNASKVQKLIQTRRAISQNWDAFEDKERLYRWIIHDWGGIRAFRAFEVIPDFLQELEKHHLRYPSVSRISSLSKIAAFYKPDQYAIYDARVSLMVNWLLRMQPGFKGYFFKDLGRKSRNTKWLPKIRWEENKQKPEYTFWHWDNSVFYTQYCGFVRFLADAIDPNDPNAFQKVEMTLFSMPETNFVDEIVALKANLAMTSK